MKSDLEFLIFEHMLKKFESQSSHLETLRNRAAIAATMTGLIGTLFATIISPNLSSLSGGSLLSLSTSAFLGFALFCSSLIFAILALTKSDNFVFAFKTDAMFSKLQEEDAKNFMQEYISDGEWYFEDNEKKIEVARNYLWWSVVTGFSQIIPWMMVLSGVAQDGQQ